MQLVRYEAARAALAEAHHFDEVKDIRDKAEAMAAYARQAKDQDLILWATEIKVRAERKCGEMLRATDKNRGAAGVGPIAVKRCDRNAPPTLDDMGLSKSESSRYQQLASMSDEHFEAAVATAKDTAGQVTTAFMLREAQRTKPQPTPRQSRGVALAYAHKAIEYLQQIPINDGLRDEALDTVAQWIVDNR